MNVHDRIAVLEKELSELKKQVGRPGRDDPLPSVKAFEEPRGVQVRELLVERPDLPSLAELKKLLTIVRPHVPGADRIDRDDPDRLLRGFSTCFRRIANLGRSPTPNGKYALTWWVDECKTWLRARNAIGGDVTGAAYIAAVLAQGDVVWVEHDLYRGQLFEAGLLPYGGKPGGDAWKRVLESGNILPALRPVRPGERSNSVRMLGF